MTASSETSSSGVSRKIWLLGLGIVVVIALYTAGWFYAATTLKATVLKALGDKEGAVVTGQCDDLSYGGYPFRIGLFCSRVEIDDKQNGISAAFGNLRSAAQVYDPGHIVWELDSPAEIRTTHGLSISSEWANLQSSLITKLSGIERTSTVIEGLKSSIVSSQTGQTFNIDTGRTEIHLRQNGADLEAAVMLQDTKTVIKDLPQLFPTLSTSADVTLVGKAGLIDGSDDGKGIYGANGQLNRVIADLGDGKVMTLTGPFSIDDDGLLSGQFKLEIEEVKAWRESLKQAFPDAAPTIDMAAKLLRSLALGGDKVAVDLAVDKGQVSLSGFVPLGKIPPI